MISKNQKIIYAINKLHKAFNYNIYAKDSYGDERKYWYKKKAEYVREAVDFIKENALPIKYGVHIEHDNFYTIPCVYFAYAGCQVSFHMPNSGWAENIKKYNGKWSNRKNATFPMRLMAIIQSNN